MRKDLEQFTLLTQQEVCGAIRLNQLNFDVKVSIHLMEHITL